MQRRPPSTIPQTGKAHKTWPLSLPPPAPVTSLWLLLHDPAAFRRTLLAQRRVVEQARAKLIRPLHPVVHDPLPVMPVQPEHQPDGHHNLAHQRDREFAEPFLSQAHAEAAPQHVDHHDFASRFRDR